MPNFSKNRFFTVKLNFWCLYPEFPLPLLKKHFSTLQQDFDEDPMKKVQYFTLAHAHKPKVGLVSAKPFPISSPEPAFPLTSGSGNSTALDQALDESKTGTRKSWFRCDCARAPEIVFSTQRQNECACANSFPPFSRAGASRETGFKRNHSGENGGNSKIPVICFHFAEISRPSRNR